MSQKVDSRCTCDCGHPQSGKGGPAGRAVLAGAIGGIVAVFVLGFLAAALLRRVGPRMMQRMMHDCDCPPDMRACMEKCCCGPRSDEPDPNEPRG